MCSVFLLIFATIMKTITVVAAVIRNSRGEIFVTQRGYGEFKDWWELPGGKAEPGETMEQALPRECAEVLAIHVSVGSQFWQEYHDYPDMLIRLTLFHCRLESGVPQALEHRDLRWIHPSQIGLFQFCPADENFLKEIQRVYENRKPL